MFAVRLIPFQFHKGAIRTPRYVVHFLAFTTFQFHKGAIRTFRLHLVWVYIPYFNSIKVRLELAVCSRFLA